MPAAVDCVLHGVLYEIALRVAAYDLVGAQVYAAEEMFTAAKRLDT